jgi:hypothetical protein
LSRYTPDNVSSPRVVTGKWLLKNQKSTARLKNKTCTNPQIKNHKKTLTQTGQTTDTRQKSRKHAFKIINTTTPLVQKTVNIHGLK